MVDLLGPVEDIKGVSEFTGTAGSRMRAEHHTADSRALIQLVVGAEIKRQVDAREVQLYRLTTAFRSNVPLHALRAGFALRAGAVPGRPAVPARPSGRLRPADRLRPARLLHRLRPARLLHRLRPARLLHRLRPARLLHRLRPARLLHRLRPARLLRRFRRCGPIAPVSPVSPLSPCAPASPCGPVSPVSPLSPASPCGPAGPVSPAGPRTPDGPSHATQANTVMSEMTPSVSQRLTVFSVTLYLVYETWRITTPSIAQASPELLRWPCGPCCPRH